MLQRVAVAAPAAGAILRPKEPEWPLPGPVLPYELASFDGAGIAHPVRVDFSRAQASLGSKIPGWVLTALVAATIVAGTLSFAFYAMPGLANPRAKPAPSRAALVRRGSPVVEVTGIRFVAAQPASPAEIRFVVVNHSATPLDGRAIQVTLRSNSGVLVSHFSFLAAGLGAFESREMASPVQNPVPPETFPDWREIRAEVHVGP